MKCILLGVSEETKGYRMFNPLTKKLIISRDVIFEENATWNWAADNTSNTLSWGANNDSIHEEELEEDEEQIGDDVAADTSEQIGDDVAAETSAADVAEPEAEEENENLPQAGVRNRRAPQWMEDYVMGANIAEEEET